MKREEGVYVLATNEATAACVRPLTKAGFRVATFHSTAAARAALERTSDGVWIVAFDAQGEAWLRDAARTAPSARFVALAKQSEGAHVYRAYEAGAAYCASESEASVLEAVRFLCHGFEGTLEGVEEGRGSAMANVLEELETSSIHPVLTLSVPLASA